MSGRRVTILLDFDAAPLLSALQELVRLASSLSDEEREVLVGQFESLGLPVRSEAKLDPAKGAEEQLIVLYPSVGLCELVSALRAREAHLQAVQVQGFQGGSFH